MRSTRSVWLAVMRSARSPSAARTIGPMWPSPSEPSSTAAAPSPNRAAVFGSSKSVIRVSSSAPMISTRSARPVSTWPAAEAQRGEPARAGGADVDGAGVDGAERGGHDGRGVRRDVVRRHGRDEHEVDVAGVDARVLQRPAAGEGRVLGQRLVRERAPARLDAGALLDPVVVDADALGDLAVRHDLGRHVMAEPDDARGARRGRRHGAVAGGLAGDRGEVGGKLGATHGQAPRPESRRGSRAGCACPGGRAPCRARPRRSGGRRPRAGRARSRASGPAW